MAFSSVELIGIAFIVGIGFELGTKLVNIMFHAIKNYIEK